MSDEALVSLRARANEAIANARLTGELLNPFAPSECLTLLYRLEAAERDSQLRAEDQRILACNLELAEDRAEVAEGRLLAAQQALHETIPYVEWTISETIDESDAETARGVLRQALAALSGGCRVKEWYVNPDWTWNELEHEARDEIARLRTELLAAQQALPSEDVLTAIEYMRDFTLRAAELSPGHRIVGDWLDAARAALAAIPLESTSEKSVGRDPQAILDAASEVARIYEGLRLDANDGEFALWSEDDLVAALHALMLAVGRVPAQEPQ